jgi:hypothetical protein
VTDVRTLLGTANVILLVDWPRREVPETLALAGYEIHVKGGPAPTDFAAWEVQDGVVTHVPTSKPPDHADIVYFHRPLDELPAIVELAARLGAGTVWRASAEADGNRAFIRGSTAAQLVRSRGMTYVEGVDIVAAVRTPGGGIV